LRQSNLRDARTQTKNCPRQTLAKHPNTHKHTKREFGGGTRGAVRLQRRPFLNATRPCGYGTGTMTKTDGGQGKTPRRMRGEDDASKALGIWWLVQKKGLKKVDGTSPLGGENPVVGRPKRPQSTLRLKVLLYRTPTDLSKLGPGRSS